MAGQAEVSKLNHCHYALHDHWVLATKYRRKCIMASMLDRFREIAKTRCDGKLMEVNGERDHVRLLISMPPNLDLSRFVNNLKIITSRLIRKEFAAEVQRVYRKPVFWSRTYCVISCGGAPLSVIKQYIEQQATP